MHPIIVFESKDLDNSKTQGTLTKLEYYNLFKALNDKWVAGIVEKAS
jgi:hypothetical protein